MLVHACAAQCAPAGAKRDFTALEMAEELVPFRIGGRTVFGAGACSPAAGDEGPVPVNDFFRVDGFVAHGGIDVLVPADQLRDMGRHAIHNRVGDK
jgi:hypothetical protein